MNPIEGGPETVAQPLFDRAAFGEAFQASIRAMHPAKLLRNPVLLCVEVGALLVGIDALRAITTGEPWGFSLAVSILLAWTVQLGTFAEALAEARGRAQASSLRAARSETFARRVTAGGGEEKVPGNLLTPGDRVVVSAGELIPGDGEVVEGAATVDESAVTGESAPVVRAAGTDRSGVTGGTRVLSDEVIIEITARPGDSFLDRMIRLVEGAERQPPPMRLRSASCSWRSPRYFWWSA
jgi:K+-transporting ATPase ATPase B chain